MSKQKGGTEESRAHTPGDSPSVSLNTDAGRENNPPQHPTEHRRTVKSSAKTGTVTPSDVRAAVRAVANKRS
jgi:hypothetical protein